jgi:hypothetical protein
MASSREIIEFMTTGGGVGSKKIPSPVVAKDARKSSSSSPVNKKRYLPALQAYSVVLAQRWLETDDQLGAVVNSIANLRLRLWETSRLLHEAKEKGRNGSAPWKTFGYREDRRRDSCLQDVADLEMTLDHDLLQHERMLSVLRKQIAALGQAQDMLGRRLDDLYVQQHAAEEEEEEGTEEETLMLLLWLDECQLVFAGTARELYRKQRLAEQILGSVENRLLAPFDDEDVVSEDTDEGLLPHRLAQRCSDQWSRTHKDSYLSDSCLQSTMRKLSEKV